MELSNLLIYNGTTPIGLIVWSFYLAVVIGAIVTYMTRIKFGKLVFTLLEKGACSPDTALTLEEAGIKIGFFIRFGLKNHLNYKDLLVAITSDGKFYANTKLTDTPPKLKTLVAITRKRKSRIEESKPEDDGEAVISENIPLEAEANAAIAADEANSTNAATADETEIATDAARETNPYTKPQRPNFRIETARYYIPEEIHAKVKTVYKENKVNILWLILILIGLGLIAFFGVYIAEALVDSVSNLGSN